LLVLSLPLPMRSKSKIRASPYISLYFNRFL
jgi:hypothetical protein